MSTSFKLDDIRAAAEAKYGDLKIEVGEETVTLLNALRLESEKRKELTKIQESIQEDDADQVKIFEDSIRLVAKTKREGDLLVKAIGGDLTVLAEIFDSYGKETQAGEA